MEFFSNGCCRFDGWSATHHKDRTIEQCKNICLLDDTCIASDVKSPQGNKYECYTFRGAGANFHTECGTGNVEERCYRKTCKYTWISYSI